MVESTCFEAMRLIFWHQIINIFYLVIYDEDITKQLSYIIVFILGSFGSLPKILVQHNENVITMTTIIFSAMTLIVFPVIILYSGALYVSLMTWVTKLSDMASSSKPRHSDALAKTCLKTYNDLQDGMGGFFFVIFFYCQLFSVVHMFLALSSLVGEDSGTISRSASLVYFGSTLGVTMQTGALAFCLEDCYRSLGTLARTVREDIRDMQEGRGKEVARDLVQVKWSIVTFPS